MSKVKLCGTLLAVFMIIMSVSCTKSGEDILAYQKDLKEVTVEWTGGVSSYSARVILEGEMPVDPSVRRLSMVEFTSPEDISGLVIRFEGDTAEATVGKVKLDLPENSGDDVYLIARLFSLYPSELARSDASHGEFRTTVDGRDVTFKVNYEEKLPVSADISWDTGEMKVTRITPKK